MTYLGNNAETIEMGIEQKFLGKRMSFLYT